MTRAPIYLDAQASTPPDPEVVEAMLPWLGRPANPHASENAAGREAGAAVERAREQVARLVSGAPEAVTFTSGATEGANIVLRSLLGPGKHLVLSEIEHPCVADTAEDARRDGAAVTWIGVDANGIVDVEALEAAVDGRTSLVSVMAVNNEVGTIQPISDIAAICRSVGVPYHADIAQALGKIELTAGDDFDLATMSSHKVHGPQGVGAIYADPEIRASLRPLMTGGGQEGGLRPGTLPVALCVGFGAGCEIARRRMDEDWRHAERLAATFLSQLEEACPGFLVNGSLENRVPHNLNLGFPGVLADELLALVPHLALSTGSACSSGAIAPSRVLEAMAVPGDLLKGSVRVGFSRMTTENEAATAAEALGRAAARLMERGSGRRVA